MLSADDVIERLRLVPHPEGGFFRETFRAPNLPCSLPERGERAASTAIYFLLREGEFSAFHSVRSDEVWHHYLGASIELHSIESTGAYHTWALGSMVEMGQRPQCVIRSGVLQAARNAGPSFALCGCTVAPGFDFSDFEMPPRERLLKDHPELRSVIESLTR